MLSRFKYNKQVRSVRAFGLVELIVCIGIMLLVLSVTVTRQSSFNGAVLLRNQAYELAFAIRQAQLLAVSGGDDSVRTYGIAVSNVTGQDSQYVLFADSVTANGKYDVGEAIGLMGKLDSRFEIRDMYYNTNTKVVTGTSSITFTRPNFDARFCSTSSCNLASPFFIDISRKGQTGITAGDVRRIEITSTGQISVVTY